MEIQIILLFSRGAFYRLINGWAFLINPIFLSEENLPLIISYYRDLIKNINVIENDHLIKEIYPNTKSGFLLKKSVVLKEDFNE